MIAAAIARLEARVPELTGRIDGAAALAEMMQQKRLPQQTPAAHVIPLGLQGGRDEVSAGLYRQAYTEALGVVLTLRTNTATGERALPDLRDLIADVIDAVAGWAPGAETGVFRLARGQLVSMSAGTIVYQLDFTITDQLRIKS